MEKFAIGLMLGALGGALLTANNYKMRTLVKKSQQEVQNKFDKLVDEKLEMMEEDAPSAQTEEPKEEKSKKNKKKALKS